MESIIDGLNEAQKIAVNSPASILQVLAPPGSGKTKTLTSRVAYLIVHHGVDPSRIIVCTFTIKAAREMRERIEGLLGKGVSNKLKLGTFHSIARRWLAVYGHFIGIKDKFGIADSSDTLAIISRIVKKNEMGISPSSARGRISKLKADGVTVENHLAVSKAKANFEQQELTRVFVDYEDHLRISNLLDYDDLLLRCTELLRRCPQCVAGVEAVLVDEFQDTNGVQYDLMNLFAQNKKTISIVGDPDQSIYGWRSAKIENLERMQRQYPDAHIVHLEENYRSSSCILLAAQEVIEQDPHRPQKCLAPTHSAGEPPTLRRLYSAEEEARWIVAETKRISTLTGGLLGWNDFAILLRSSSLSRLIENELAKAGIPYKVVGGVRFFDRIEVKLVLDYLRVLDHPGHSDALERIINVPSRKIGETTVRGLVAEADRRGITLWEIILKVARGEVVPKASVSKPAQKGLESFVQLMHTARKRLGNESDASLAGFVQWFVGRIGLHDYLKSRFKNEEEQANRLSNVQELIAQVTEAGDFQELDDLEMERDMFEDESHARPVRAEGSLQSKAMQQFLANVALSTEIRKDEDMKSQGCVTLSTVHAAKGLEWAVVFIPAAYNGCIPHSRAENHDEERRLLYVAMTRAQALLYLSCTTMDSRKTAVELSPFLTAKNVRCRLSKRGPRFTYDLVNELAKIMRRETGTLSIEAGRKTLSSLEDDQFPHTRDKLPAEDAEDDSDDDDFKVVDNTQRNNLKRIRQADVSAWRPVKRTNLTSVTSSHMPTTTMQQSQSFSMANTSLTASFMSARDLPQHNKENRSPWQARGKDEKKPPMQARPKTMAGQKDIAGYLDASTQPTSAGMPPSRPRNNKPTVQQSHRSDTTADAGAEMEMREASTRLLAGEHVFHATLMSGNIADIERKPCKRLGVRPNMHNTWGKRMSRNRM